MTRKLPVDESAFARDDVQIVVDSRDRRLSSDEIAESARDADALLPQLTETIDRALLERLPRVKVIANYAVGVNNIDLAAARSKGIVVCNTPDVLTDATADLTLALILALARRVREGERIVRSGELSAFAPGFLLGRDLRGSRLGLFGLGRIGQAVAHRALAFGMELTYTARNEAPIADVLGAQRVPFAELLRTSDVLSIHAPLTPETRHAFDAAALASMKRGALLINTSRGPLVDEAALVAALASGSLGGAGLDVYENEPAVHPGLVDRDDVVLLPHVGSATQQTRAAMATLALENCVAVLTGNAAKTPVA